MAGYLVGIDIGGTFTDCAIVDGAGKLLTTKVPSTPSDFSRGMMDALGVGAEQLGLSLDAFCGCGVGRARRARLTRSCVVMKLPRVRLMRLSFAG